MVIVNHLSPGPDEFLAFDIVYVGFQFELQKAGHICCVVRKAVAIIIVAPIAVVRGGGVIPGRDDLIPFYFGKYTRDDDGIYVVGFE